MLIDAYMNHGRWVADCPEDDGYSDVPHLIGKETTARLTGGVEPWIECPAHGRYVVMFPAEWSEIEAVLNKRPGDPVLGAKHANWRPGETVESLRAENVEHGVFTEWLGQHQRKPKPGR